MPNQSKTSKLLQQKQQAASQNTSSEQLRTLAYTSRTLMLRVAENNAAPPELLRELAASSKTVCERVAANPNTPIDVLLKLGAKFPKQLLNNPILPLLLLENPNLVENIPDQSVRSLLAANTNTPLEILEILARDRKYHVRHRAANNPKMPIEKFAKITLERIAKTLVPSFSRFIVFLHAQAPQEALVKNYRSESWLERYAIAQNPNTPKHILNELTLDANQIVRAAASSAIKHIM